MIDQSQGVLLVDLNSKAKTFINNEPLIGLVAQPLQIGDSIQFGQSSRTYKVKTIDYSRIQNQFEKEAKDLERELNILKDFDENTSQIDPETLKKHLGFVKQDTVHVSNIPYKCD